jgi:cytoskeletal protein RodZ
MNLLLIVVPLALLTISLIAGLVWWMTSSSPGAEASTADTATADTAAATDTKSATTSEPASQTTAPPTTTTTSTSAPTPTTSTTAPPPPTPTTAPPPSVLQRCFQFLPFVDSDGNDIRQAAGDVEKLAADCNSEPSCKGFNSNGWMKHTLNPTMVTWTPDPKLGFYKYTCSRS